MTIPAGGRTGFVVAAPGVAIDVAAVGSSGNPVPNTNLAASGYGAAVLFPGDIQGYANFNSSATTGADGHATLLIFPVGGAGNTATAPANAGLPRVSFDLSGHTNDGSLVLGFQESPTNRTAPSISCAAPDGVWHSANVSRGCTASSPSPGLAKPRRGRELQPDDLGAGRHPDERRPHELAQGLRHRRQLLLRGAADSGTRSTARRP